MMAEPSRVFHISPQWCGQERVTQIFRLNGHRALYHLDGEIAQDILFAQGAGTPALAPWPRVRLFSGLYGDKPGWQPPLEAWRSFAWLHGRFPDALFILTTRDPDGWLVDRITRDGGAALTRAARRLGLSEADIPDIWLADWQAHLAAVRAYFGDDPRLLQVDMDRETPQDLCRRLAAFLPFDKLPHGRAWLPPAADKDAVRAAMARLDGSSGAQAVDPETVARDMAEFCLAGLAPDGSGLDGVSQYFCAWDGDSGIAGKGGKALPLVVAGAPTARIALTAPEVPFKLGRAAGVINDILGLGRRAPVRIDMEDSRWMGTCEGAALGLPVLCHNRREGARNVVLWPLPGQHNLGLPGFDPRATPDPIPFEDKLDRVVWRGMISGNLVTGDKRPGPPAFHYLAALAQAGGGAQARDAAWRDLSRTSRLGFVLRWFGHPDFDLGIVMAYRYRHHAADPCLAPYCTPRVGPDHFHRFRYQLYMAGYDHGSNFITAIDSQSVLLKEEDGWEVFYSGRFKPWKHYIPLERYCADIQDKLAWARENPGKCKEMSAAARAEAALLRDPRIRRAMMGHILDAIAGAG